MDSIFGIDISESHKMESYRVWTSEADWPSDPNHFQHHFVTLGKLFNLQGT